MTAFNRVSRYVAKPRGAKSWWGEDGWDAFDEPPARASLDVDEPLPPQFTGLYDKDGAPLYRLPEKIGFR